MTRAFVDRFAFHVNVFYPSIVEVIQLGPWKGIKNLQGEVCLKLFSVVSLKNKNKKDNWKYLMRFLFIVFNRQYLKSSNLKLK